MKIATWNINSVRIRIPLLKALTERAQPDVICLQETKTEDQHFPLDALKALGYPHIVFSGQKSYNGVAILSKLPLTQVSSLVVDGSDHKRHISARLPGGEVVHNFYIPAGGDIPDPEQNPAYAFKLRFVEWMTAWAVAQKKNNEKLIMLGDFNIAPLEHDVWSSKQLRNVVSHTEPEITRLNALKATLDWIDAPRHFVPSTEKLYSWWSYRNRDWQASNRGRRLDHLWVTPPLAARLARSEILSELRSHESPSDHVPVVVALHE